MTDAKTAAMWLLRMIMLQLGAWMTARGFGDDATWQAVTGGVLALGTMVWSWYATKAQIAQPAPGVVVAHAVDGMLEHGDGVGFVIDAAGHGHGTVAPHPHLDHRHRLIAVKVVRVAGRLGETHSSHTT